MQAVSTQYRRVTDSDTETHDHMQYNKKKFIWPNATHHRQFDIWQLKTI